MQAQGTRSLLDHDTQRREGSRGLQHLACVMVRFTPIPAAKSSRHFLPSTSLEMSMMHVISF